MINRKYEWLRRSRTLLIDGYWPPLNPGFEFDAGKLIATAKTMHANTLRFATAGKYSLLQNSVFPMLEAIGDRDTLQEVIDLAKPAGIRVIAYVPVSHGLPQSLLTNLKPEWALRLDSGELGRGIPHFGGEDISATCPFGQYRDDILTFITQVVEQYDIDGLYLDGPYYDWPSVRNLLQICQCEACKNKFNQTTGLVLPTNAEYAGNHDDDLNQRRAAFMSWIDQGALKLLEDICNIAKKGKDLPVLFNAYSAGSCSDEVEKQMIKTADGLLLEAEMGGLRGLAIGEYHNKIIWRYTETHLAWPRGSYQRLENRHATCGYETILWGGTPIVSYGGRFYFEQRFTQPVKNMLEFLETNEEILSDTVKVTQIAIVSLQGVHGNPELQPPLEGMYLALQNKGWPCAVLPRAAIMDMESLLNYEILILPDLGSLTVDEAQSFREYTANGGKLLASAKTSINQKEFLLSDVFGIELLEENQELNDIRKTYRWQKGIESEWNSTSFEDAWDIYCLTRSDVDFASKTYQDLLLPVQKFIPVRAVACKVLADLVTGADRKPFVPGIVENNYKQGKAIYIATNIESTYRQFPEMEIADLINDLLLRLLGAPAPYTMKAPSNVFFSVFQKSGMLLFHILDSDQNRSGVNVNCMITLPPNTDLKTVESLTAGTAIEYKIENNIIYVELSFERYECVCVKLKGDYNGKIKR